MLCQWRAVYSSSTISRVVPQRSNIGALLFLAYINDLPDCLANLLSKRNTYYYQSQGVMAICQLKFLDFVVYTVNDIHIYVQTENLFWWKRMGMYAASTDWILFWIFKRKSLVTDKLFRCILNWNTIHVAWIEYFKITHSFNQFPLRSTKQGQIWANYPYLV